MNNLSKYKLTSERLNLVIATCAILISAASFYATFLQADSAKKQVRAMTLPLIQFEHGNYDGDLNQRAIDFTLENAGVGPAIVHSIELVYRGENYPDLGSFLRACCGEAYETYIRNAESIAVDENRIIGGGMVTNNLRNVTLAGQSDYMFLQLYHGDLSRVFWEELDQERWQLSLDVCYCTLLDDCFRSQGNTLITEINSCPAE